eukprot:4990925-Ditylum_brightwellii.AAC.1
MKSPSSPLGTLRRSPIWFGRDRSSSMNRRPYPITSGVGGRKFFRPRTMKLPVVRYSPVGAVFDT